MAGVKISALPASPGLDGTELVPVVAVHAALVALGLITA